ncbi:MAG TPA: hypothetical protein VEY09_06095 [Pyrinomonadaceae bacterium]|nr:hypothetical protein [Pyrinomonadaceae bacterium]
MPEVFDWVQPSLLWGTDARRTTPGAAFFSPPLLGFEGDDFMEQFLTSVGARRPEAFAARVAAPGVAAPLKLFQPSHGRYYLTCASLCCRQPGFPDREVRRADGESVFFVLRKRVGQSEFAWVAGPEGSLWQHVARPRELVPEGEERLPLMPAHTADGRPLHFGFIPAASGDTYVGRPGQTPVAPETGDPRRHDFDERIAGALESLLALRLAVADAERRDPARRRPVTESTLFFLLDLGEFLEANAGAVFSTLSAPTPTAPASLGGARRELALYLRRLKLPRLNARGEVAGVDDVAAAIARVCAQRPALRRGDALPFGYNAWDCREWTERTDTGAAGGPRAAADELTRYVFAPGVLDAKTAKTQALDVPKLSKFGEADRGEYFLRYVYERPQCDARRFYVSRGTVPFTLASFFDLDAPARPIRIALPADVSVAGLRKFKKNVAFMMSKELRNKMAQITGREKDILDGKPAGPEGGLDIGHICSFSIPVITLCAFIVLMIFLVLLNIIFWWLPFLKICLPLRLTAKDG